MNYCACEPSQSAFGVIYLEEYTYAAMPMDEVQRLQQKIVELCGSVKHSVMVSTQLERDVERGVFIKTGRRDALGRQDFFYLAR